MQEHALVNILRYAIFLEKRTRAVEHNGKTFHWLLDERLIRVVRERTVKSREIREMIV